MKLVLVDGTGIPRWTGIFTVLNARKMQGGKNVSCEGQQCVEPWAKKCRTMDRNVPNHVIKMCRTMVRIVSNHVLNSHLFSARVHLRPHWPGWRADGQCLLGALLSGARHPAGRNGSLRLDSRRWWWRLQHLLCRDRCWQTCAPLCLHRPGTNCYWWERCDRTSISSSY